MSQVLRKGKQRLVFAKYRVVADTAFKTVPSISTHFEVSSHWCTFHVEIYDKVEVAEVWELDHVENIELLVIDSRFLKKRIKNK